MKPSMHWRTRARASDSFRVTHSGPRRAHGAADRAPVGGRAESGTPAVDNPLAASRTLTDQDRGNLTKEESPGY